MWAIFGQGHELLNAAGYLQYETSGYSKPTFQCQHLNYWRFGDYLGIGCGAHGKISQENGTITRTVKVKHPRGYLDPAKDVLSEMWDIDTTELAFEYFMNRFRLREPCPKTEFSERTGLSTHKIESAIQLAISGGYLKDTGDHWQVTKKGRLFLNDLLEGFL